MKLNAFWQWCLPLLLMTGCARFEYIGQSFTPIPDGEVVAYYKSEAEVPPGVYRIIGRGVITAKSDYLDNYDVEERLLEEARSRGADAVALISSRIRRQGLYHNDLDAAGQLPETVAGEPIAKTADGTVVDVNRFEPIPPAASEERSQSMLEVKALFYKRQDELNRLLDGDPVTAAEIAGTNADVTESAVAPAETPASDVTESTVAPAETPASDATESAPTPAETPASDATESAVAPAETPASDATESAVAPAETPASDVTESAVAPAETPKADAEK